MSNVNNFFMHFCPGTKTIHADSINSDLQRGLDRRLRHTHTHTHTHTRTHARTLAHAHAHTHTHTPLNIEQKQLAIKVSADNSGVFANSNPD